MFSSYFTPLLLQLDCNSLARMNSPGLVQHPYIPVLSEKCDKAAAIPVDITSARGMFGWTTIDGITVAHIFREEKRFVAVRMVEQKFVSEYLKSHPEFIHHRPCLVSYYATTVEAELLTEINMLHCGYEYGHQPFRKDDLLVKVPEFEDYYEALKKYHTEQEKLHEGQKSEKADRIEGGWLQINNTVSPFVLRDGLSFVPLSVLRYAAGLLTDSEVDTSVVSEEEWRFLNAACEKAGLKFKFSRKSKLVALKLVIHLVKDKVAIRELPREKPFSHAEYQAGLNKGRGRAEKKTNCSVQKVRTGKNAHNSKKNFPSNYVMPSLQFPSPLPYLPPLTAGLGFQQYPGSLLQAPNLGLPYGPMLDSTVGTNGISINAMHINDVTTKPWDSYSLKSLEYQGTPKIMSGALDTVSRIPTPSCKDIQKRSTHVHPNVEGPLDLTKSVAGSIQERQRSPPSCPGGNRQRSADQFNIQTPQTDSPSDIRGRDVNDQAEPRRNFKEIGETKCEEMPALTADQLSVYKATADGNESNDRDLSEQTEFYGVRSEAMVQGAIEINGVRIERVTFHGKYISVLYRGAQKQMYAIVEVLARVFFPSCQLDEFENALEVIMQGPLEVMGKDEENACLRFYQLPIERLSCPKLLRFSDLDKCMSQLHHMFPQPMTSGNSSEALMISRFMDANPKVTNQRIVSVPNQQMPSDRESTFKSSKDLTVETEAQPTSDTAPEPVVTHGSLSRKIKGGSTVKGPKISGTRENKLMRYSSVSYLLGRKKHLIRSHPFRNVKRFRKSLELAVAKLRKNQDKN